MNINRNVLATIAMLILAGCQSGGEEDQTWAVYLSDAESSQYSSLDQINVSNVNQLQEAWRFEPNDMI